MHQHISSSTGPKFLTIKIKTTGHLALLKLKLAVHEIARRGGGVINGHPLVNLVGGCNFKELICFIGKSTLLVGVEQLLLFVQGVVFVLFGQLLEMFKLPCV